MLVKQDGRTTATGRFNNPENLIPTNVEGQETVSREFDESHVYSVLLDNSLDRKHKRITVEFKIGDI